MLMFVDIGGGGVNEKITDYGDMGRGLQNVGGVLMKRLLIMLTCGGVS